MESAVYDCLVLTSSGVLQQTAGSAREVTMEKWSVLIVLRLHYLSAQYLGKVSVKVSLFCQDSFKM